jgi:hypothetical protein
MELNKFKCHYCSNLDKEPMLYIISRSEGRYSICVGTFLKEDKLTPLTGLHLHCLLEWIFLSTDRDSMKQVILKFVNEEITGNI